jgi:hypothetical protein
MSVEKVQAIRVGIIETPERVIMSGTVRRASRNKSQKTECLREVCTEISKEKGARQRKPLPLPARQSDSPFGDPGLIAHRHLFDLPVYLGQLRCFHYCVESEIGMAEGDVLTCESAAAR